MHQAAKLNITRYRGDTWTLELILRDTKTKLPRDITGYSYLLTVNSNRAPVDISTQVVQFVGVVPGGSDGKIQFPCTLAQADQVPSVYKFDVQETDTSDKDRTIIVGNYSVPQDITK